MSGHVAIVGARNHPHPSMVREYVRSLPKGTVVVSGGARGVDDAAESTASAIGLTVHVYRSGEPAVVRREIHACAQREVVELSVMLPFREAALYRNTLIAIDCDRMVVFPDGSEGGCWDAARDAVRFKRPVEVRWADGRVEPYPKPRRKKETTEDPDEPPPGSVRVIDLWVPVNPRRRRP